MNFLGNTFLSNGKTMKATSESVSNIDLIKIQNGVYDELYASKDVGYTYTTVIPTVWDFNTVMRSLFEEDLNAGNVGFTATQVSAIRIKRREKGSYNWLTLYEIPINAPADFEFERRDMYARSGVEYEYAVVPIMNGAEGSFDINTILSEFSGMFIVEKERAYHTDFEVEIPNTQRNQQVSTIKTLGRKYPYHVKNALMDYESGTAKGFFVDCDTEIKVKEGSRYRKEFKDFLTNGSPKILKTDDGRIWLVAIIGNPTDAQNGHKDFVITSFQWEETGDYESSTDLYNANLTDVNIEGS